MKKRRVFKIVETGLMGVALWWGVLLILPLKTFINPAYGTMAKLMPETGWAIQCLVIAVILAAGMITGIKIIRNIGLLLSIGFWTFVSVSLWLSDYATTSTSYLIWAILAAWLYIHLMKVGDE